MTRITNLGHKRTYLEAGFTKANADDERLVESTVTDPTWIGDGEEPIPKRKPRKRRRKGTSEVQSEGGVDGDDDPQAEQPQSISKKAGKAGKFKQLQARRKSAKGMFFLVS